MQTFIDLINSPIYNILQQQPDLPDTHYNYANPDLPLYFNNPGVVNTENIHNDNPITDEGATHS